MTDHIREVGGAAVCTSIVVAAELRFGAKKKGSAQLTEQLEGVLAVLEVRPREAPADERYGEARWRLEREGPPIGGNDLLIAAHALALDCAVVTANVGEFERVDGLHVESWLLERERARGGAKPQGFRGPG